MTASITTLHPAAKVHDIPLRGTINDMGAVQRRVRERLAAEAPMAIDVPDPFERFEATHAARRAAFNRFHGIDTPDDPPQVNVFAPLSAGERAAMAARKTPHLRTFADDEPPPDDMPSRIFDWMAWAGLCGAAGVLGGFVGVHLGWFMLGMGQ